MASNYDLIIHLSFVSNTKSNERFQSKNYDHFEQNIEERKMWFLVMSLKNK